MKAKIPASKTDGNIPQHVLNKELTRARTAETQSRERANITRDKKMRMELAERRDQLILKKLVIDQAAYLFVAMRQKMLAAPLAYARKFVGLKTQKEAHELLTEMQHELLRDLHDMPAKVTDPNWVKTLEEDDEG